MKSDKRKKGRERERKRERERERERSWQTWAAKERKNWGGLLACLRAIVGIKERVGACSQLCVWWVSEVAS